MNGKEILLAVVARLLLPDRLWERLGEITEADLRRVDDGQKKVNKWLEERANERARECGVKEGDARICGEITNKFTGVTLKNMAMFKRYQYKNECVPTTMLGNTLDRAGKDGWELKYLQIDEEKSLARMVYMREEVTSIYGDDYYIRKDMAMYMQQMQDMERTMKEYYDSCSKLMDEMMNKQ